MNKTFLNVVSLAKDPFIRKDEGGGGGVTINNQEKSVDITENGVTEVTADSGFTGLSKVVVNTNVASSGGGASKWTGHADVEGLKAIGWTDEDIAYYQENGVNWNEEDDDYHKVTDDNKALYGVLTAGNIQTYKDRIVYLPKIDTYQYWNFTDFFSGCNVLVAVPWFDTSQATSMARMFQDCNSLVCVPMLDTAKVTDMSSMFYKCYALVSIPQMDTASATNMSSMFNYCYSLVGIPPLNTSKVTDMNGMFNYCYSLIGIPPLDTSKVTNMNGMFYYCYSLVGIPPLDTSSVTKMNTTFQYCYSLVSIPSLDIAKITSMSSTFNGCKSLVYANIKNAKISLPLHSPVALSKESLLYIINNEAATSAISISLHSNVRGKLESDPDVLAALAAHPNISI